MIDPFFADLNRVLHVRAYRVRPLRIRQGPAVTTIRRKITTTAMVVRILTSCLHCQYNYLTIMILVTRSKVPGARRGSVCRGLSSERYQTVCRASFLRDDIARLDATCVPVGLKLESRHIAPHMILNANQTTKP